MNKEELLADLGAIFDKELFVLKTKDTFDLRYEGDAKYRHLTLLEKLYLAIEKDTTLEQQCITYIWNILLKAKEYHRSKIHTPFSLALLSFVFFFRIGKYDNAIRGLETRKKSNLPSVSIIMNIPKIFGYCNPILSSENLEKLKQIISEYSYSPNDNQYREQALEVILTRRFQNVENKIESSNIEVNSDKQKVIIGINKIGINKQIAEYLNDLELYIINGKPKDYAGNIATLRNAICDFIIELADNLSKKINEPIPSYKEIDSHIQMIGRSRRFIKDKYSLTDKEHQFIDRFIDILQDEGGHSFGSNKEYLRLSKNIAIEIMLFLLTKHEQFVNE